MKLLLVIFMFLTSDYDINKISKSNRLKKEAETAFKEKDYATAIEKYTYLIDTLGVNDDKLYLNLAHAYFQKKDSLKASQFYQKLIFQNDNLLKSTALNQLGIISSKMGNKPEALQYLKEAMKANPSNEEARYNYQLLKLQKDEHKDDKNKNNKNDKNKDNKEQQNKEQQNKEQQNKEQQNKEQQNKEQQNKEQQNKEQQNKEQQNKEQ
ncbi:MAG: tetratricopeptide repeat protein, partial [Chitinophagaceae bacterium]|nr:tetratricopeptide repeat protein [Chitinophagaceae bacterium]